MKAAQISVVMYGHDAHLLETRKWVLEGLGYRVFAITHLAELDRIPIAPPIALLVLCHTLSPKDAANAVAQASLRWPGVKKLALLRENSKAPSRLPGRARQTLDGPTRLMSMVTELVGYAGSSSYSHIY